MKRSATRLVLCAASAAAPVLAASPATAQMAHLDDNDWRQADRHDIITKKAERPSFAVEVRFGPYLPGIDGAFASATPFNNAFGYDCGTGTVSTVKPRLYFGLEFDALPLRIPYIGIVGVGVGWGFTSFSNYAQLAMPTTMTAGTAASAGHCAQESTTLTIMPMHGSFVLRVDELMRRTGIPIVPYGKAGSAFSWWRASNEGGTETYCSKTDSVTGKCLGTSYSGSGFSPTLHFALGGMLALNFIDPRSSARLDETTGVHHAYVFGEWYTDTVPLSTRILRVGTSSFVVGLAADM